MSMLRAKRIVVFNVNWLGDVLFSTPVIRNIRRNFPESYLACIVPSRCYQVLRDNPYLDEIIIFDEKDRHRGMLEKLKFVKLLKSKNFDTAFLLHRSFRRALICRLAGIRERIGHYTRKRGFLLTKSFKPPVRDSIHRIDYYLDIIEKAGLKVEDRFTDFYFRQEDVRFVEDFLSKKGIRENEFLVGINPGGNWQPKRWPREYWAILADSLIDKFHARVFIFGAQSDLKEATAIAGQMKNKPIIAAGILSLKQFAVLAKKLDLFITGDTGPLHIANSVGTKNIIAIFGPTDPEITGPFPAKNAVVIHKWQGCKIPCYNFKCKDNLCMKAVTPQMVMEEVETLKK